MYTKQEHFGHCVDFTRLSNKSIILDCGSCVGEFIDFIKPSIPFAQIIAIEANPKNFKILQDKSYDNTTLVNKVLYHELGIIEFIEIESKNNHLKEWGSIFYKNLNNAMNRPDYITHSIEKIECITLESLIKEFNLSKIDLVKMDIEGAEFKIFETISSSILSIIDQITLEYHGDPTPLIETLNINNFNTIVDSKLCELYGVKNAV